MRGRVGGKDNSEKNRGQSITGLKKTFLFQDLCW
jgi:hypothetical protein